jgi:RHH-type transcriptional regulator, proline utilization regulon repressor / proline dehydrogenase / delta 1-pyrroline-5-carboxylate dehydrogenase
MEMERVEASLRGWPQAPYKTKLETDANYKRMLLEAMQPENLAMPCGWESPRTTCSNWPTAWCWRPAAVLEHGSSSRCSRAWPTTSGARVRAGRDLLLYAPACRKKDFLTRSATWSGGWTRTRGPTIFWRHAFKLQVDSGDWQRLEQQFRRACSADGLGLDAPRRTQDRTRSVRTQGDPPSKQRLAESFVNEPDTDFSLPHNTAGPSRSSPRWESLRHRAIRMPL